MNDAETVDLYQPIIDLAAAACKWTGAGLGLERCLDNRFWRIRGPRVWRMVSINGDIQASAAAIIKTVTEVIEHERDLDADSI